jgi:hypothetical protein
VYTGLVYKGPIDSTRVNETMTFINNNANFPQARRQAAAQFCRQTYPKLSLFDFGPYKAEFETLADELPVKQHATVPAGGKGDRAKAAQAGMTMPTANLDAALEDAILKAAVCASAAGGGGCFPE